MGARLTRQSTILSYSLSPVPLPLPLKVLSIHLRASSFHPPSLSSFLISIFYTSSPFLSFYIILSCPTLFWFPPIPFTYSASLIPSLLSLLPLPIPAFSPSPPPPRAFALSHPPFRSLAHYFSPPLIPQPSSTPASKSTDKPPAIFSSPLLSAPIPLRPYPKLPTYLHTFSKAPSSPLQPLSLPHSSLPSLSFLPLHFLLPPET